MFYEFPKIEHINDVLPAIEGRDEFFVAERPWGKVVNYLVNYVDTFPPVSTAGGSAKMREEQTRLKAIRRECRGLLFYPDGRIMSRRLHKFFNLFERDETMMNNIDFNQPHVILEKLDGSMITPILVTVDGVETIKFGTKMGCTEVSAYADEFVNKHHFIYDFCLQMMLSGYTPIFEWVSRKQRIVIDYPQDRLVLIAVRNTVSGEYTSYATLLNYHDTFGIDVVKAYDGTANDMEALVAETRDLKGAEGYVVRFDNGHMIKIKAEEYLLFHKTKDNMTFEKNIIDLLVNDKIDDAKSFMLDDDREQVIKFENMFWFGLNDSINRYNDMWKVICSAKLDRKRFAIERMPALKAKDPHVASIVFGLFDGKDLRTMVLDLIRKNCNTQTKVNDIRYIWGGATWNYRFESDN